MFSCDITILESVLLELVPLLAIALFAIGCYQIIEYKLKFNKVLLIIALALVLL